MVKAKPATNAPVEESSELPENFKEIGPEQMILFFQNQIMLIEGNATKSKQKVFDQMGNIMMQYIQLNKTQGDKIKSLDEQLMRIQRLCREHNIDPGIPKPSKAKNRKERRAEEKAAKKEVKKRKK